MTGSTSQGFLFIRYNTVVGVGVGQFFSERMTSQSAVSVTPTTALTAEIPQTLLFPQQIPPTALFRNTIIVTPTPRKPFPDDTLVIVVVVVPGRNVNTGWQGVPGWG